MSQGEERENIATKRHLQLLVGAQFCANAKLCFIRQVSKRPNPGRSRHKMAAPKPRFQKHMPEIPKSVFGA